MKIASSPKVSSAKTPIERRDERLKELAEGKLLIVSLALAKQWNDDFDEVLQHMLFTCLKDHEVDVAAGLPEKECFLFQTDGYVATRCGWRYKGWRNREMRQVQLADTEVRGAIPILTGGRGRSTRVDKLATRMDVRAVLAKLEPAQAKFCRLLMAGHPKGVAGRRAGEWSPYQSTMERYKIRDAFTAAGVTP